MANYINYDITAYVTGDSCVLRDVLTTGDRYVCHVLRIDCFRLWFVNDKKPCFFLSNLQTNLCKRFLLTVFSVEYLLRTALSSLVAVAAARLPVLRWVLDDVLTRPQFGLHRNENRILCWPVYLVPFSCFRAINKNMQIQTLFTVLTRCRIRFRFQRLPFHSGCFATWECSNSTVQMWFIDGRNHSV